MPRATKLYKGMSAVFLPLRCKRDGMTIDIIHRWEEGGGTREKYLSEKTTHIFMRSFESFEEHLQPFLGLQALFRQQCQILDEEWIWHSSFSIKLEDIREFELGPEEIGNPGVIDEVQVDLDVKAAVTHYKSIQHNDWRLSMEKGLRRNKPQPDEVESKRKKPGKKRKCRA